MGKLIDGKGEVQENPPLEADRPQGYGKATNFVVQATGSFIPPPSLQDEDVDDGE